MVGRPLVACRAAIYAALVPADAFTAPVTLHNAPDDPSETAARNHEAERDSAPDRGRFHQGSSPSIPAIHVPSRRRKHILASHAEKLGVSVKDILKGDAPRLCVLDMFAGGGLIPLRNALFRV